MIKNLQSRFFVHVDDALLIVEPISSRSFRFIKVVTLLKEEGIFRFCDKWEEKYRDLTKLVKIFNCNMLVCLI